MSEPPSFDGVRAAFWLVSSIIGVHALTIVTSDVQCFVENRQCTEITNSLRDLLTETMAVALAFGRLGNR